MAISSRPDAPAGLRALRWPLRLTWAGMLAEYLTRALWPLLAVIFAVLAVLMLGLHDMVSIEAVWGGAVVSGLGTIGALVYAFRRFRLPTRTQALARLDASLPGRPIQALMDDQAIGHGDAASAAVWAAHQKRMAQRASGARAVPGNLQVARHDPFALRYVALTAFVVALLFGSIWRVGSVAEMTPGGGGLATGPVWEGWAESPRYTGRPTIYLNDIPEGSLKLPAGSLITLRLYGEVGALTVAETVSGRVGDVPPASGAAHDFTVTQSGNISVSGPGGRSWQVAVLPDAAPQVEILDDPESAALGEMTLPFGASDDYGVEAGEARIALNLDNVERRYGLTPVPEERPEIIVPLPMPIAGDRRAFEENFVEDFSEHPWANLPVTITLSVLDAAEQQTESVPRDITLPGRRFFDPLAAAIIEMRRDLLWNRSNAERSAQVLRAVSYKPDEIFRKETLYLQLRQAIRQMETLANYGMTDEQQQELADDLWDLAIELEEGDLADALDRMRQAQERLEQAMREGASEAEIAELMNELRRATEDYLKQLGEQAQREAQQNGDQQQSPQDGMQMTQDDLQRMMDEIQELMEQGRMAEAEEALRELQEMMENMRVTQGQGQNGQSPGEQAMEGLSETLRDQQGLSDEAFRDLQEQFNPDAQAGESQGNRGRSGNQGQGQQHSEGEGGEGEGGSEGAQNGQQNGQQQGQGESQGAGSLADRQQALRDELSRQQGNMPGAGTPEGDAAREALERAGRAMEGAEEALREGDNAGAIDNQAQAMEALREGMRALGEAMAQQERDSQPGQGTAEGDRRADARDPLGRTPGANGGTGTEEGLLQGEDVYRRARELLDEIRRRSSQGERPQVELDYLERLLDRF
ncbi:TIGR02302 family protein [Pseudosulfitobacter koreensis]|uniref:TIGR02302 family protein n=1 Tax=Pseudosulfitobacter koreensis TaxID=2968472 RepID=A0ABT1Z2N1_9RHOB|nr:TIGR02302 family protein [Pseudosulfitobacter koreense]MCR8827390.1 TIGR02302 family protein [Pseudosulfitobacter koreense]